MGATPTTRDFPLPFRFRRTTGPRTISPASPSRRCACDRRRRRGGPRRAGPGTARRLRLPTDGTPGQALPDGWDQIPGARGCTPQSCAYRDAAAEFGALGASLVGISAQGAAEQTEFAAREHIPFPPPSDPGLELTSALGLPTFEAAGMSLFRRLTFVAEAGTIVKAFYPVFPPDQNAADARLACGPRQQPRLSRGAVADGGAEIRSCRTG